MTSIHHRRMNSSNWTLAIFVKLVFRFADETDDREDGQCERMWVKITGFDDDGYFVGTIENDPQHDATKYGEILSFHPLHVAEIYVDE